jgi:hypothetical protein
MLIQLFEETVTFGYSYSIIVAGGSCFPFGFCSEQETENLKIGAENGEFSKNTQYAGEPIDEYVDELAHKETIKVWEINNDN